MTKLKTLPVNKTVVFNSPIEGDDVLVRTGIIQESSSFFHSLLYCCSNEYVTMDKKDRMKFVHRLRASITGKIDIESWEEIGGGIIAKIPFQELLKNVLYNFNLFLNEQPDKINGKATRKCAKILINEEKDIEVYQLILNIISIDDIENNILSKAYANSEGKSIKKTIVSIIEEASSYIKSLPELNLIDNSKKEYLTNVFIIFLKVLCNESHKEAYKRYIKALENTKEEVDSYTIEFVSNRFNKDLYFINGENRLPYHNFLREINFSRKKSIVLICIDNKHYEIVGRLLPGNRIQREFDSNDPFIKKINTFLLYPERVPSNYPELKQYIPKYQSPVRNTRKQELLVQEEKKEEDDDENNSCDNESDEYYDSSDDSNGSDSE